MDAVIAGRPLVAGNADAIALVTREPLSFWGGYDQATGEIIDRRHPLSGQNAAGRILVLPLSRGSSTTAAVLLEAIRRGTAPAAIVTDGLDPFLLLGAIVAEKMYAHTVPVVAVSHQDFERLNDGMRLTIREDGRITIAPANESGDNR